MGSLAALRVCMPALAAVVMLAAGLGEAQSGFRPPVSDIDPALLKIEEVKFLGLKLDENLPVTGADGREFKLGDFAGRPLILIFSYFTCDGLCPAFNAEMMGVLEKVVSFNRVKPGKDFNVLTLSFDKNDTVESAAMFERSLKIPESLKASWRVGIFRNPENAGKTTSALGFKYFWSPGDRVFLHSNLYYFVSPDLRVARILQDRAAEPKDMELAILDSKFDKLRPSEVMNVMYGLCFSYNYKDGKYGLNYPMFISFGSLFTGVAAFLIASRVYKRKVKDCGGLDMRNIILSAIFAGIAAAPGIASASGGGGDSAASAAVINDPAEGWDNLWDHVLVDLYVIGVIFTIVALYFILAYRRTSDTQEGAMPKLTRTGSLAWAFIPAFVFLADDFFLAANGWKLWNDQRHVPKGALEVQLTGQMYNWTFDYGNGVTNDTDSEGRPILTVPAGKPVVLRMTSEDVVHSFFIPDFRIKEDLMPGRVTYLWFYPKKAGEHVLTCTEYCGMGHSNMWGKVKVLAQADFDAFIKAKTPAPPAAEAPAEAAVSEAAPAEAAPAQPAVPAGGNT